MQTKARNALIGIFVMASIVLVVYLILFLHPSVGDEGKILRVRFTNIEKITVGSRVTFAGRPVGQVVAIHQIRDERQQRADPMGRLYVYQLVLAIDSNIKVYSTDEIFIHTSGLFGEKNIAIVPVEPPEDVTPVLITDQVLYARSSDQMSDLFGQITDVASQVGEAFDQLSSILQENRKDLRSAITAVKNTMGEMGQTFANINDEDLIPLLAVAADNVGELTDRLNNDLAQLDDEGFWEDVSILFENLATASDHFVDISANIEEITDDLRDGKGTIGRLFKEEELYFRTIDLMNGGKELVNNLNSYGLLFQYNKEWKRQHKNREYPYQLEFCR